ncbi:outer dense fiber protein 3-like [Cimex lectularius]|uniref:Uncharacterized protein n=1 Tax=Cimex lectularius TaxID=79782 RepID=A0A8I6RHQ4_CIMLE|nr:outer dense fiber protein 3-like [Cimex lectularius]
MHSPGPKYLLPTTVGYDKHDITRPREPAYSLNFKISNESKSISPGPKYQCDKLSNRGPYQSKSAFLSSRFDNQEKFTKQTPGAGKYYPNIKSDSRYKKSPEASHLGTFYNPQPDIKPGPKYMLAGTLGRGLEFPSSPCACLIGKSNFCSALQVSNSPGPGKYFHTNMDIYLRKSPGVPLGAKRTEPKVTPATIQPGPKYYGNYNKIKRESPAYSLGVRHSWKQMLLRMPNDGGHYYGC